jgi:hypothetical protein
MDELDFTEEADQPVGFLEIGDMRGRVGVHGGAVPN